MPTSMHQQLLLVQDQPDFGSQNVVTTGNATFTGLGTIGGGQFNANTTPSSGSGVEVFKPSSTAGRVKAYNRTGSAWMDLILKGATQQFHVSGTERMRLDIQDAFLSAQQVMQILLRH